MWLHRGGKENVFIFNGIKHKPASGALLSHQLLQKKERDPVPQFQLYF